MRARLPHVSADTAPQDPPPRERILSAARTLFYRDGLHAVGVEAIAAAANTNKMTLYRHFGSKDQLIAAYIQHLADEGDALWLAIEATHPDDPQARLQLWLETVDQRLKESGARGCAIANAAVELPPTHPARHIIEDYKLRKRDRLMRLLNDARYADPGQLADEIFLMFEGAQISMQCAGKSGPASRLIAMVRALLSTARKA